MRGTTGLSQGRSRCHNPILSSIVSCVTRGHVGICQKKRLQTEKEEGEEEEEEGEGGARGEGAEE